VAACDSAQLKVNRLTNGLVLTFGAERSARLGQCKPLLGEDGLRKLRMKSHELVINKREDPVVKFIHDVFHVIVTRKLSVFFSIEGEKS
ncbi:21814_t:CDS:2, partial [Gigaspora margarita]